MYASYFGMSQEPFSIAPDPRYLFMSERHREALAHLLYGISGGGGFVLLSGEIGAGKTTVCRCLLEQIPRRTNVAYIFNPRLTVLELLQSVCEEFGVSLPPGVDETRATVKRYLDPLNQFLLKTHAVGQNNVLIIDEAQMLSAKVLEQLRLLTNLETSERKLLQIILIGQPELRDMLARPELEQLAQRVIAHYHLEALTEAETEAYIGHRLAIAGMKTATPFDAAALRRIHQLSRGVPRRINLLCDRALLGAYTLGKAVVDRTIVDKAAGEVFQKEKGLLTPAARSLKPPAWAAIGVSAAVVAFVTGLLVSGARSPSAASSALPDAAASASVASASAASTGGTSASVALALRLAPASRGAASVGASGGARAGTTPAVVPEAQATVFLTAADLPLRFKTLTRDSREAWRELSPAWKLALEEADGDPCVAAARARLYCWRSSSSSLALIRELDRPGILTLLDENNRPVYALLTGLTGQSATLRIGAVSQTVSLASLATLWRGDFATFWRAPPGYASRLVAANSGEVASWLALQLATLQGERSPSKAALTDAGWRSRLAAFQLAQGLKPDGLAGPTTFMQLNRAVGIDEPHLRADLRSETSKP